MLQEVLVGAITSGVNKPTLLLLNVAVGALWLTLAFSLYATATSQDLRPLALHFAVMLGLCSCMALLLNWFIANAGLTSVETQQEELQQRQEGVSEDETDDEEAAEKAEQLRQLPLQSNIDIALAGVGSFDTSSLQVQPLAQSSFLAMSSDDALKVKES